VDAVRRTGIFLVSSAKHTGVGREALCHARLLSEAGWRAIFCCQKGGSLQAEAEKSGLLSENQLSLPTRSGFWRFFLDVWRMRQMARRENPAAIFTYRSNDQLVAALACGRRKPVIRFWSGAASVSAKAERLSFLLGKRWCDAALCASPSDALRLARFRGNNIGKDITKFAEWDECREEVEKSGVYFLPAGVDTACFSPNGLQPLPRSRRGWREDETIFGMVAPLKPERGHSCFLKALAAARAQEPAIRGLIIASSTRKEREWLAPLAAPLRLGVEVELADPGAAYGELLRSIDAGVILHPGSAGMARAALEMLCLAKPVIAAAHGLLAFLGASGAAYAIPPPASAAIDIESAPANALAKAMVQLHRDRDLRIALGQAGRRLAEERFSPDALRKCLAAILTSMRKEPLAL